MPGGTFRGWASKAADAVASVAGAAAKSLRGSHHEILAILNEWESVRAPTTRQAVQGRLKSGQLFAEPGKAFLSTKPTPSVLTHTFISEEDKALQRALIHASMWETVGRRVYANLHHGDTPYSFAQRNLKLLIDPQLGLLTPQPKNDELPEPKDYEKAYFMAAVQKAWGNLDKVTADSIIGGDKAKFANAIDSFSDLIQHQPLLAKLFIEAINQPGLISVLKDCLYCGGERFRSKDKRIIREGMAAWLLEQLGQVLPPAADKPDTTPMEDALKAALEKLEKEHLACRNRPERSWTELQSKITASSDIIADIQALPLYKLFTPYDFGSYHDDSERLQTERQKKADDLAARKEALLRQHAKLVKSAEYVETAATIPKGTETSLAAINPTELTKAEDFDAGHGKLDTELRRIEAILEAAQARASRAVLENVNKPKCIAAYKKTLETLADNAAKLTETYATFQTLTTVRKAKEAFDLFHAKCNEDKVLENTEAFDDMTEGLEVAFTAYKEACELAQASQETTAMFHTELKALADRAKRLHDDRLAKLTEVAEAKQAFDQAYEASKSIAIHVEPTNQCPMKLLFARKLAFIMPLSEKFSAYEKAINSAQHTSDHFQKHVTTYQSTIKKVYAFDITAFQHDDFNLEPLEERFKAINQAHLDATSINILEQETAQMKKLCQDAEASLAKHQAVIEHLAKLEALRIEFESMDTANAWIVNGLTEVKAGKKAYEDLYQAACQPSDIQPDALGLQIANVKIALATYQTQLETAQQEQALFDDQFTRCRDAIEQEEALLINVPHGLGEVSRELVTIQRHKPSIAAICVATHQLTTLFVERIQPWTLAREAFEQTPSYSPGEAWAARWHGVTHNDFAGLSKRLGFTVEHKWPSLQKIKDVGTWLAGVTDAGNRTQLLAFINTCPRAQTMHKTYQAWMVQLEEHQAAVYITDRFKNTELCEIIAGAIATTRQAMTPDSLTTTIMQHPVGTELTQMQRDYLLQLKNLITNNWHTVLSQAGLNTQEHNCSEPRVLDDNAIFDSMETFYNQSLQAIRAAIRHLQRNPSNIGIVQQYQATEAALGEALTQIGSPVENNEGHGNDPHLQSMDYLQADAIFRRSISEAVLLSIQGAHEINTQATSKVAQQGSPSGSAATKVLVPIQRTVKFDQRLVHDLIRNYHFGIATYITSEGVWEIQGTLRADSSLGQSKAPQVKTITLRLNSKRFNILMAGIQALPTPYKPWQMHGAFGEFPNEPQSKQMVLTSPTTPDFCAIALLSKCIITLKIAHPNEWSLALKPLPERTTHAALMMERPKYEAVAQAAGAEALRLQDERYRFQRQKAIQDAVDVANRMHQAREEALQNVIPRLKKYFQGTKVEETCNKAIHGKCHTSDFDAIMANPELVKELRGLTIFDRGNPDTGDYPFDNPFALKGKFQPGSINDPQTVLSWLNTWLEPQRRYQNGGPSHDRTRQVILPVRDIDSSKFEENEEKKEEAHTILMTLYYALAALIQWMGSLFIAEEKPKNANNMEMRMFAGGEDGTETTPLRTVEIQA